MNKSLKVFLIVIGIISFLELQLCLFFVIKTNIDINKSLPNTNDQMNGRPNFNGNSFQGNPPSGNFNDDISNGAITPGENNKNKNSKTDNT